MRYSTSEMAKDITEVLDHLEWTKERQLNVVGISLGGMIAQELGLLVPKRIASLSLVSTAAAIKNTVGFIENLRNRINLFIPRSLDAQVAMIKHNLFSPEWLSQPDESEFVKEKFPTNGDRIGAGEVAKRMDTVSYPRSGFVSQALAAGWHYKSPEQLASLGDQVGRERIMVVHGGVDRMITIPHVHVLINGLGGEGSGIAIKLEPGQGHVLPIEMRKTFNGWVEELVDKAEQLSRE
ncbi:putative alpha beta hydrolase protein [Venturia nashicola]|nr:putative alpha beta hydrolase protein [Venturia nashicola]